MTLDLVKADGETKVFCQTACISPMRRSGNRNNFLLYASVSSSDSPPNRRDNRSFADHPSTTIFSAPKYGTSAAGIVIEPSGFWHCSKIAT